MKPSLEVLHLAQRTVVEPLDAEVNPRIVIGREWNFDTWCIGTVYF